MDYIDIFGCIVLSSERSIFSENDIMTMVQIVLYGPMVSWAYRLLRHLTDISHILSQKANPDPKIKGLCQKNYFNTALCYWFVTPVRLELTTQWLRVICSTNWATESFSLVRLTTLVRGSVFRTGAKVVQTFELHKTPPANSSKNSRYTSFLLPESPHRLPEEGWGKYHAIPRPLNYI